MKAKEEFLTKVTVKTFVASGNLGQHTKGKRAKLRCKSEDLC